MQLRPILSVGIDVGTTSTHLTFSRLHLANISRPTEPGRMVVSQREIVYQSRIHYTPLTNDLTIDAQAVELIVREEYASAGFAPADVETGAVIITGETAKTRNAEEIVHRLSKMAGQFVVASAGPNLESLLSARGSGAAAASRLDAATICNIDIGGGTSNYAVFQDGQPVATACLNVGGRFIQLSQDMRILALSGAGRLISEQVFGAPLNVGETMQPSAAKQLAEYAAQLIVDVLSHSNADAASDCAAVGQSPPVHQLFLMTQPLPLQKPVDAVWLSGGVAETIGAQQKHESDSVAYGDLGIMLGHALKQLLVTKQIKYVVPPQPIRATVIGAGTHSLQLSGSTIAVTENALPANNVPVIRPLENLRINAESVDIANLFQEQIQACLSSHDLDWKEQPVAIFLPELSRMGYNQLQIWSRAIARAFDSVSASGPLILICSDDVAAALGQQLRKLLPNTEQIVLDGIYNTGGDYIDIGKPVANKQAIPVVLKDLIFVG